MATVFDVARYILDRAGAMSPIKLQKLVYYSQAWSLVWDGNLLFDDSIQAWANGPVVPALFNQHRGTYWVSGPAIGGNADALLPEQRETIEAVLETYGDKQPFWLSELTHKEAPWREARIGTPDGSPSQAVITPQAMFDYYSSL